MIRALILDAGQVIVRSEMKDVWNIPPRAREIIGDRADVIGTPVWLEACSKESHLIREDVFVTDTEDEYRRRRAFVQAVAADIDLPLTEDEITALARDLTDNPARYIWFEDVDVVLARLKGKIRLAVLSDAMPSVRRFIGLHDTRKLIEEIVLSTEVGATKPSPKMYQTILNKLGCRPEECLFADDRIINLEGARAFGIKTVQVLRFEDMQPEWERYAHDLYEIEEMIERENG